jgi:hypothetical protein
MFLEFCALSVIECWSSAIVPSSRIQSELSNLCSLLSSSLLTGNLANKADVILKIFYAVRYLIKAFERQLWVRSSLGPLDEIGNGMPRAYCMETLPNSKVCMIRSQRSVEVYDIQWFSGISNSLATHQELLDMSVHPIVFCDQTFFDSPTPNQRKYMVFEPRPSYGSFYHHSTEFVRASMFSLLFNSKESNCSCKVGIVAESGSDKVLSFSMSSAGERWSLPAYKNLIQMTLVNYVFAEPTWLDREASDILSLTILQYSSTGSTYAPWFVLRCDFKSLRWGSQLHNVAQNRWVLFPFVLNTFCLFASLSGPYNARPLLRVLSIVAIVSKLCIAWSLHR